MKTDRGALGLGGGGRLKMANDTTAEIPGGGSDFLGRGGRTPPNDTGSLMLPPCLCQRGSDGSRPGDLTIPVARPLVATQEHSIHSALCIFLTGHRQFPRVI